MKWVSIKDVESRKMQELRMAAIVVQYLRKMGGKEAWNATVEVSAYQQRRVERFRAELQRILGERKDILVRVNGGCVEADVEDLRFVANENQEVGTPEPKIQVTLLGRCPACGAETMSEPFTTFAELGAVLERFRPIYSHFCLSSQGGRNAQ